MVGKPKRSAAPAKSSSSTIVAPVRSDTGPATATAPSPALPTTSTRPNTIHHPLYKDGPGPTWTNEVFENPDHRPSQPYQGAATQLRHIQQSPVLNSGQSHQSSYGVQGVFSPHGAGLQSPYLSNPPQFQSHQPPPPQPPPENPYYTSNPSPRSTTSAYYPSDKSEPMATATTTMQRPYPPIYRTPQSNSPASVTSPQGHDPGRAMYSSHPPPMQPTMYNSFNYSQMGSIHQSPYQHHAHPHSIPAQPMMPYPPNQSSVPQPAMSSQPQTISSSPRLKSEPSQQHYGQTPQGQTGIPSQRQSTGGSSSTPALQPGQPAVPPSTSSAAPGPIPATTPLVVRQDNNGVQWIAFEYSRDRVKMEYTIRCDVESVDATQLSQEFKGDNCVYPRACVPKEQYKGNRLAYETDCNQVGWALAELNPCLRGKRGLIQRAVDSWRNSNQDPRLRSRRVRRQAKMNNRSKMGALNSQAPGPTGSVPTGLPGPPPMGVASTRPPVATTYSTTPGLQQSSSAGQHMSSPNDLRQAHTFPGYGAYPAAPSTLGPSMPPSMSGGMHGYGRPGGNVTMASHSSDEFHQGDIDLYGDIPEGKRRKFILVDDPQKNARVRVKVTLDQVEMSEIPDSYRKNNSVFPRAYFPVQMRSAAETTMDGRFVEGDVEEMDDGPPTVGRMTVPCQLTDGMSEVEIPHLTRGKRDREQKLNELGYRLAWGQSRVFSNRPLFLGRALDAYRNKQRTVLAMSGEQAVRTPPHLETRPGKRRWLERTRPGSDQQSSALIPTSSRD